MTKSSTLTNILCAAFIAAFTVGCGDEFSSSGEYEGGAGDTATGGDASGEGSEESGGTSSSSGGTGETSTGGADTGTGGTETGGTTSTGGNVGACTPKTCLTIAVELQGDTRVDFNYAVAPDACGIFDDGCGNFIDCGGCDSDVAGCGIGDIGNNAGWPISNDPIDGLCQGGCMYNDDDWMSGKRCYRCFGDDPATRNPFSFIPNLNQAEYTYYEDGVLGLWCKDM